MCSIYSRYFKHFSLLLVFLCPNFNRRDELIRIMCFFFCTTGCTGTTCRNRFIILSHIFTNFIIIVRYSYFLILFLTISENVYSHVQSNLFVLPVSNLILDETICKCSIIGIESNRGKKESIGELHIDIYKQVKVLK